MPELTDTGAATRTAASPAMLLFPGDPGWEDLRRAWHLTVDQRPAAVALPETAEDVVAVVDYARIVGLHIVVRATGNGTTGASMAGVLLVDTARLTGPREWHRREGAARPPTALPHDRHTL